MQIQREWHRMGPRSRTEDGKIPSHIHALPQWHKQSIGAFHEMHGMKTVVEFSSRERSLSKQIPREKRPSDSAQCFDFAGQIRDTEPRHACTIHRQGM
ncbi:hypothetical protein BO85DRAFT_274364 [Aspergillus piperis CBS 112811]|uniref:Uncharacterized protein n=1 Tax=Aspergillus piperis CBS 112811 TaxID=1448313 RepID=A0A8G1R647_9EURO|nr:hypothetical protein BO85DRAFT_274364 [Aspergillus piperis CBS 112811]RAH58395.1 hypothetical protein BO85DRAFT_274364 [Aspergillus piperis CBS 112811]